MTDVSFPLRLVRRADWHARLWAVYAAARTTPFEWGTHDCILWMAQVVDALTGVDCLPDVRGQWSSEDEAAGVIDGLGGLQAGLTLRFGQPLASVSLARRGDVVLLSRAALAAQRLEAVAVCFGGEAVSVGINGLLPIPMRLATAAWRVGR